MRPSELQALPVMELSSNIEILNPELLVAKIIGFMRERKLSEAFVAEKERTAIVTLRDLLKVQNITTTKVSTVMSYIPRLNPNNNVGDAATLMFEHRIRSLPIYRNGKPVGKIDTFTIIDKVIDTQGNVRANRLMTPDPITLEKEDDIGKARRIMIRRRIDQIPVINDGKIHGVVSSASIVYNILPTPDRDPKGDMRSGRFKVPIENLADSDLVQNDVGDSLSQVFKEMKKAEKTYSVITSFEELQGIITHRDFMRILSQKPSDGIPMYIVGLPEDPFEAEAAREKFSRIIKLVRKGNPDTLEARAIIRAGETKSARKRYQVQVFIMSPRRRDNYTAFGFELPDVFDEIESWAKKLVSRYDRRGKRTRADPGALSSDRPDLWVH
ncbi:MAG: CBS domain-containing protein [archaeon]|nr:CBS domain-containing protein [archaeon]